MNTRIENIADRLVALYACVSGAPAGEYADAKRVASMIDDAADSVLMSIESVGLKAPAGLASRQLRAAIYRYIKEVNPQSYFLDAAEAAGAELAG